MQKFSKFFSARLIRCTPSTWQKVENKYEKIDPLFLLWAFCLLGNFLDFNSKFRNSKKIDIFLPAHHFLYLEFAKSKCKIDVGDHVGVDSGIGCSKEDMLRRAENESRRDRK